MKDLSGIGSSGYIGQLVFVRMMKDIDYSKDHEVIGYYDKPKAGFILEVSKNFDGYYLIRFFSGEKSFHWGVDLFEKTFENNLTE
jgi:hypothetical protein